MSNSGSAQASNVKRLIFPKIMTLPVYRYTRASVMEAKTLTTTSNNSASTLKKTQPKVLSTLPAYKVTKPGVSRAVKVQRRSKQFLQALQRPVPPPGRRYAVQILENGLVDVEKTPDYLEAAVERNKKESPLLRLPEAIKRRIWEYALGGSTIDIGLRSTSDETSNASPSKKSHSDSMYQGKLATTSGNKRKKPKAALFLPQVCRLIYSETATLTYSLNTFSFTGETAAGGPDSAMEGWVRERIPAQFNAIEAIRPHWQDLLEYINKDNKDAFKQLFPQLKRLRVPSNSVNYEANWPIRGDPMRKHLRQQAKEQIANRVSEQEGGHVEVIFRDVF